MLHRGKPRDDITQRLLSGYCRFQVVDQHLFLQQQYGEIERLIKAYFGFNAAELLRQLSERDRFGRKTENRFDDVGRIDGREVIGASETDGICPAFDEPQPFTDAIQTGIGAHPQRTG